MPVFFSYLILFFAAVYVVILVAEALGGGFSKRWTAELTLLLAALVVLHLVTGFPGRESRQAFGAADDLGMVALMFVAIVAGMAARYLFYLRGRLRWRSFLKPLCVSPMVLLPLLGTLPFGKGVEPVQMISFAILAFQNGFFWRVIFERAKTGT